MCPEGVTGGASLVEAVRGDRSVLSRSMFSL